MPGLKDTLNTYFPFGEGGGGEALKQDEKVLSFNKK